MKAPPWRGLRVLALLCAASTIRVNGHSSGDPKVRAAANKRLAETRDCRQRSDSVDLAARTTDPPARQACSAPTVPLDSVDDLRGLHSEDGSERNRNRHAQLLPQVPSARPRFRVGVWGVRLALHERGGGAAGAGARRLASGRVVGQLRRLQHSQHINDSSRTQLGHTAPPIVHG